jgi:predicted permease
MSLLSRLGYDLRHALRGLRRDRGFTTVVLLSLAIGIGANAAVFSLVDQLLVRTLPVKAPGDLVQLDWRGRFVGSDWGSDHLFSHPFYRDLEAERPLQQGVFAGLFGRAPISVFTGGDGGPPARVQAEIVSGSYFGVLGVGAALGRVLDQGDDQRKGAHPVVVLSHDYWRNRLGAPADIVGRKLSINRHPMTVVGVAAPGFRGMDRTEAVDLWVPIMMKREATPDFDWLEDRRGRWLHVFGRLRAGVTVPEARAALQPWFKAMLEAETRREGWPRITEERRRGFLASTLELLPGARGDSIRAENLQRPLLVLLGATGLVLVLACLNVANLSLARAFARRRELAVRAALGASRGQLARQMGTQAVLLAVGGGLLGVVLAPFVSRGLLDYLPERADLSPDVDPRVFAFCFLAAAVSCLLFGVVPALHASRARPSQAMKQESASVAGGMRLRKTLVVGQIALALVLLIGAGLFVQTLAGLRLQGPGYRTTNLVTFDVSPIRNGYQDEASKALMRRLLAALERLPEVESAGLSTSKLLSGGSWNGRMTIAGPTRITTETFHRTAVSPDLFRALGVPIVAGRGFDARDQREEDVPGNDFRVAIINERAAREYFPGRSPIGARIAVGTNLDTPVDIEIVGVVKTFHYRGVREAERQVYFPAWEGSVRHASFFVRTGAPAAVAEAAIRAAVRGVDPTLPLSELRTVDQQVERVLVTERMLATLATAFAALALLLAVIGLYGVMSFVVTRRTREIGIRMALGALPRAAVTTVLRETAWLVLVGLGLALPAVWALGRVIESQLHGVRPLDAATLAAAAALMALVALVASALPARRASAVAPTEALRAE